MLTQTDNTNIQELPAVHGCEWIYSPAFVNSQTQVLVKTGDIERINEAIGQK
jgi:hypothetical protein